MHVWITETPAGFVTRATYVAPSGKPASASFRGRLSERDVVLELDRLRRAARAFESAEG